jgi:hypothetical protein
MEAVESPVIFREIFGDIPRDSSGMLNLAATVP